MVTTPTPTERELDILKILWERQQATVRQVYEDIRVDVPIVQNTVQALLRMMEEKGLVKHRMEGRAFVYFPTVHRERTTKTMVHKLLESVFDGSMEQLVDSLFSLRKPSRKELDHLESLIAEHKQGSTAAKNQDSSS
jgi:predicted transcriptional regulator